MKRLILVPIFIMLCSLGSMAQSFMTDSQVIDFVIEQQQKGVSQSQIVTKLMQKGVDISQIRRVKKSYDRLKKGTGLGAESGEGSLNVSNNRMRNVNGDTKKATAKYRIKEENPNSAYDSTNVQFMDMQREIKSFSMDSIKSNSGDNVKKVFGRDIFNNKSLSFEPNMNIATPQNYRLGPGDAVYIDIYGASQKTVEGTVSPDGTVTIEGFGPVQVSGLTVAQANSRLRSQLGARYQSSNIRLTVGQTRTIMVNVMGEVKVPGTYTLSAFATVFHALYMAGGINNIGTLRNIKVYRGGKLVTVVDIYDYILNGKLTGNVRLADNDVIVVGPYDCLVDITGKVKRPMYYEMRKNESVETLLKYSGGFKGDAYKKTVRLVRKTGREYSVFNIGEFDMNSFHLSDEDSVSVDSIIQRYSNMVELKGAVFRPGMYQIGGDINSVRTLLLHADGIKEDAFTAHAVMHRMKKDRTLEVVPVDIEGIMSGKVADIPMQNEDVLFIPSKEDGQISKTITIHGEVYYPGVYKYAENESLEDFVLQAGGLKDAASSVKVDISRRISDQRAITTSDVIANTYTFSLKDGFVIDGEPGFKLEPYDEVYVRKSPGYSSQQNVSVEGEVLFSGSYTLQKKDQRISEIINAAGGLTNMAYVRGARLERKINPDERLRMEAIVKMAQANAGDKDIVNMKKMDIGDTYFVGIELEKALENPGGDADVTLREGDRIIVPQYNPTVKISGDVMYPNTVSFKEGKRFSYYIDQAGGFGNRAKKSHSYIIYMNGTVAKVGHNAKVLPGCEIVVPSKPQRDRASISEIFTIGTSVASIATMIATLANVLK
ncbi:MAG TPA: SLBB domain-containing protein [Xylanibacter oryzae]|nr:SLBB domain-containing protein [Xylanibacter oryzae]